MSGGGGDTITQTNEVSPYAPSTQYLDNILGEASNLYQSGTGSQYYPGSTVVPFATQTQQALGGLENLGVAQMSGSPMIQQAGNVLSGYAAGQAPSVFAGGQSLNDFRNVLANQAVQGVQQEFAGMGRTGGSPMAQAAATEAFGRAFVPTALQFREAELGREQAANALAQAQQLQAASALPGIQSAGDARALAGAEALMGAGGAYEDLEGRRLQEDLQRFQYEQMSPYNRLAQYAGIVTPIASGFPVTQQAAQQPRYNALTGALGGGMAGASAASMLGSTNPYFALGGALLGGLGGMF
tara:strand:+ start:404 stop:1297 length:894 start_codon:yes stop_codon:yes gene_type:complete